MSWQVHETQTRLAIKDGDRTIAYVAIGAEIHAQKLAAAQDLLHALKAMLVRTESIWPGSPAPLESPLGLARAAVAKAEALA